MKVSGFTVIRNAEIMGYPIIESIKSLLPLVDEFIVGIGQSSDKTKEMVEGINNQKLKIFDSFWDPSRTQGGLILSEKTNEALKKCTGDWCFYLQADEVLHEQDYSNFHKSMETHLHNKAVEGILSPYLHFYGSYGVIATSRNWYRNEVRIVRNHSHITSFGDAQGFRVQDPIHGLRKPFVKPTKGTVYHYGWVKPPAKMGEKNKHMFRWWHGNKFDESFNNFAYKSGYGLKSFQGLHPTVMEKRVREQNWSFQPTAGPRSVLGWNKKDFKNWASDIFEKLTGRRIGEHKNYILLKS